MTSCAKRALSQSNSSLRPWCETIPRLSTMTLFVTPRANFIDCSTKITVKDSWTIKVLSTREFLDWSSMLWRSLAFAAHRLRVDYPYWFVFLLNEETIHKLAWVTRDLSALRPINSPPHSRKKICLGFVEHTQSPTWSAHEQANAQFSVPGK